MLVDVTILYKTQADMISPSQGELEQVDCIRTHLDKWECPQDFSGSRKHMVQVWRLGIVAYLRRLFPSTDHLADVVTLMSQVFNHAELISPATSWNYSLLWPIFQVGVTLGDGALEEKAWIRRRLKLALGAVGCRHFSNALETLEFVWDNHAQYNPLTTSTYRRTIMLG